MKSIYYLTLGLIFLIISCSDREWNNPYDTACSAESWVPSIYYIAQGDDYGDLTYNPYITIVWFNPVQKFDHVIIERAIGSDVFTEVAKCEYGVEKWIDNDITRGGELHKYRIYAEAGNNKSIIEEEEITPVLLADLDIQFENLTYTSVTCIVSVDDGGGPINHYDLSWSMVADFSEIEGEYHKWDDPGESFTYDVQLEDNTKYYFQATAQSCNSERNLEISYSDIYTITTPRITHIVWDEDQRLLSTDEYYTIVEIDNLIINDNVEITNYGTSQLVLNVADSLVLGKNVVIRVRNGYYENAPTNSINDFNFPSNDQYFLAPNTFGKGGRGGNGTGNGGGGGGGYGGGAGGSAEFYGSPGEPNGGDGGAGSQYTSGGAGGGQYYLGKEGFAICGGGGNGGNSEGSNSDENTYGGGGGGYGGGVLVINANKIIYDVDNPPKFLVSGQKGGNDGYQGLHNGIDGEGGLLIINCPTYSPNLNHYNLDESTYGDHNTTYGEDNGHGIITGNPTRVFINGVLQ